MFDRGPVYHAGGRCWAVGGGGIGLTRRLFPGNGTEVVSHVTMEQCSVAADGAGHPFGRFCPQEF